MVARFLAEANRVHDLVLKRDQDFVLLDHPLDIMGDSISVERLEQYMQDKTCPKMLEEAKKDNSEGK